MLNDILATLPLGIVAIMGCLVLLVDAFGASKDKRYLGTLTAAGMVVGLLVIYLLWDRQWAGFETPMFGRMMAMGQFELATCAVLLIIGFSVTLLSLDYAEDQRFSHGELYALINFAIFGMMVLATAKHMVTLFIGLELMSLSVYILAAIKRQSHFAAEAGMKYFVLGAFASGLLLYGIAFLYGETGSLAYWEILAGREGGHGMMAGLAAGQVSTYFSLALFLIIAAFGFKLALVPFHSWTPDVYEGAPVPVTALMATGVKTAGVVAMGRLFVSVFPARVVPEWLGDNLFMGLAVLAVLTMTVGNVIAIHQKNLKRMLAYSSIAHAGYLLIGIMAAHVASNPMPVGDSLGAVLFYLFVYSLANIAAFAVIAVLSAGGREDITLDDVAGLSKSHPVGAVVIALAMLSLAGIPPTAGFFGKFALFREALDVDASKFMWLVVVAMINSVISVYYYLRVVVYAYMRDPVKPLTMLKSRALAAALALSAIGTVYFGVMPGRFLSAADSAAHELVSEAPALDEVGQEPATQLADFFVERVDKATP